MAEEGRRPDRKREPQGIRTAAELKTALLALLFNFIYVVAAILVAAALFKLTDWLLLFLLDPLGNNRFYLEIPLAGFTGLQFLRRQEYIMGMLNRGDEDDETPHLPLAGGQKNDENTGR